MNSEVCVSGTVAALPRFFYGSITHAMHEAFNIRTDQGKTLEVVDNVAIAPRCPVKPGDRVTVKGEYLPDGSHGPMIHWTHRDPDGKHQDGYIDLNGRIYA
jgi:Protein of unknown function (DUF3465)